jgi:hypothetical protein
MELAILLTYIALLIATTAFLIWLVQRERD